jgi:N-carbamoylputrescine amidase
MAGRARSVVAVAAPFGRDLGEAFARVERVLAMARRRHAGLVVFPECALGGYLREPEGDRTAPELPPALAPNGEEIARLVRLAGDTVVCIGYTEAGPHGPYSAAVCVSGDGVLGRHRKVHVPPAERFALTAGDGFAAFDTPVGRLGMLLCYDKLFPEAARALALDGARTIASMAAWPIDRRLPARRVAADRQTLHFDVLDIARAVENQAVWVSSNLAGRWGPLRFLGHAKVVGPDGAVLARTGHRPGLAVARVDAAAAVPTSLRDIDHLGDRRPAAYALREPSPPGDAVASSHSSNVGPARVAAGPGSRASVS